MSEATIISMSGGFSPIAEELARMRVRDFTPVMGDIRDKYMRPLAQAAWAGSGLRSISGELHGAVTPFAGKVSAGVGLRTVKGRDLVLAKAITHTFGRDKWSSKRRFDRKTRKYRRRSPWGDIPARPFTPSTLPGPMQSEVESMVIEYVRNQLARAR